VEGTVGDSSDEIVDALKLKDDSGKDRLAPGSRLFRRHCLHCHGLTGDGHGPTAEWVNPHPRDYRLGKFKFSSSSQPAGSRKPRREDLKRTLRQGIEGTSMPSFGLLPDAELEELISYVIHLSLRGEVEFKVILGILGDTITDSVEEEADKVLSGAAANWVQAEEDKNLIKPGPYPGLSELSVKNGHRLFLDEGAASCVKCHKDFGRQNNFLYDDWGTIVRPLDLTSGVYRGGRRPIDFYWRIHSGINGANMPAFYDALKPSLNDWELLLAAARDQVPAEKITKREQFGIEVERLAISERDRADLKKLVELDKKEKRTPEEEKERDSLKKIADPINGRLANQRSWDLINFLQILPFPEMRRKYDIELD
jgi:mono/diheme cytochrome c family protein